MGLRSRLPSELGYGLTVLAMLSMPHPEEQIGGLPLRSLEDIFIEIMELIEESVFGSEGYERWRELQEVENTKVKNGEGGLSTVDMATRNIDKDDLTFFELELIGQDIDAGFLEDDAVISTRSKEYTGGSTDIALSSLNILRNFSMLSDNHKFMASHPEFFILLSRITDICLARFSQLNHHSNKHRPYSILELARVRRDVVMILTNIGSFVDVRTVPFESTLSIFRTISSFIHGGFEDVITKPSETIYGPNISARDYPPYIQLSLMRAVDAFTKLSFNDLNREILSALPPDELITLFVDLVKLLPITSRQMDAMKSIEDCLGYSECLSLALYSLVFLSPTTVRHSMRQTRGTISVITRLVGDTLDIKNNQGQPVDFKSNPYSVLGRRLCECLGLLNGNQIPGGQVGVVGFGCEAGDGLGWRMGMGMNGIAGERGWLLDEKERLMGCMGVRGIDQITFRELDNLLAVE